VSRIAFGTCAHQDHPQPFWDEILSHRPELCILGGDNIYADTTDPDAMRAAYRKLGDERGFKRLRSACPLLATWDDHDYGQNDAGADYPMRAESERIFLDFFEVPSYDPRRLRRGVYHARTFGPPDERLQVILLDTRSFRSPRGPRPNTAEGATLLGAEQWSWLEAKLRDTADVRLLVTSIQLLSREHDWEKWADFPRERARLLTLLESTEASGVILLSGDRHMAELARSDEIGYPLWEVTSSPFNGKIADVRPDKNRYRAAGPFHEHNFAMIEIDWADPDPIISLRLLATDGRRLATRRVPLSTLRP